MKRALKLFLLFIKIGLFTFGGGYAMISLVENEFVTKRKTLTDGEFLDLISVAESTPGPIAINMATYVGYKECGFLGAVFATLGVITPSFIIIFVISLFLGNFLKNEIVLKAFKGVSCAVAVIILFAGIKLLKSVKKNVFCILLFIVSLTINILCEIKVINFSYMTIALIVSGGILGIIFIKPEKSRNTDDNPSVKIKENE